MRGRNRIFHLSDLFPRSRICCPWIVLFLFLVVSGCAHFSTGSSASDIWRSTSREPVWIRHDLPPQNGFVYLKSSATSRTSLADARNKAKGALADMLVGRFLSMGFHFTDRSRESYRQRILESIALQEKSLSVVDSWETKTLPDPRNPFLIERHAWILVRAASDYVESFRQKLETSDRERFDRIRRRHREIYQRLRGNDGTKILLLLARNRRAFRSIHALKTLSPDDRKRFDRYLKNEFVLWDQFMGSATVRSLDFGRRPLRISSPFEGPTVFSLDAAFRMAGREYPLQNFKPVMFLQPVLSLLPFPPPPILWRGTDVSSSPYRLLSLYWSADLGWYDRYKEKNRLVYHCTPTSAYGKSLCQVRRWPLPVKSAILKVGLEPLKKDGESPLRKYVAEKVHGRFPVWFPGPRGSHPLEVQVLRDSGEPLNGARVEGQIRFVRDLERDLSSDGFWVVHSDTGPKSRGPAFRHSHQRFRLILHWSFLGERSKKLGATSLVIRQIVWNASVSNFRGETLWGTRGKVSGAGVGPTEAMNEALAGLRKTVAKKLSALLWRRPTELPDDRFSVMRMSLLDGRSFCGEDESP